MRKLIVPVLGTLTLLMSAGCGGADTGSGSTPASSAVATVAAEPPLTVSIVIDGGTVALSDGRQVRLLGVDAPERGECGYEEASAFARNALSGKRVTVTPDSTQAATDQYGRSMLYIQPAGGQDYSVAVADAGLATHYIFEGKPVQKASMISEAEDNARRAKRGIWGPLCVAAPTTTTPAPSPTPEPAPVVVVQNDDDGDVRRAPAPAPAPAPREKKDSGSAYYKNCSAARAAGAAPVTRGEPGYGKHLDRDGDGVGCE